MVTTVEEDGQLIFEICLFLVLCMQFHIDLVFSEDIVKVFVLVPCTGFAQLITISCVPVAEPLAVRGRRLPLRFPLRSCAGAHPLECLWFVKLA